MKFPHTILDKREPPSCDDLTSDDQEYDSGYPSPRLLSPTSFLGVSNGGRGGLTFSSFLPFTPTSGRSLPHGPPLQSLYLPYDSLRPSKRSWNLLRLLENTWDPLYPPLPFNIRLLYSENFLVRLTRWLSSVISHSHFVPPVLFW